MKIKLLSVCAFLFVTVPFSANAVMEASWDDEGVELAEKPEHCPMMQMARSKSMSGHTQEFTVPTKSRN